MAANEKLMRIKSIATGQEENVTAEQWDTIQKFYKGKHSIVQEDITPPEAKAAKKTVEPA